MRSAARFDLLIALMLGLSLGLLTICVGLWREAMDPELPGARVVPGFHSVAVDLGFNSTTLDRIAFRHLEELANRMPEASWMGAIGATQPVLYRDQAEDVRFDLVFGPLLGKLGLPDIGRGLSETATRLPISHAPIREAVLSRDLATRLFGSPHAAVGQFLRVATFKWRLGADDFADFEIVGVVTTEFRGTDIEHEVDAWLGINGWHGVLFPEQQLDVVRDRFGAGTLAVITNRPADFAVRLEGELDRLGEASATVNLVPGAGYHPERRARFLAISEALFFGLQAMAALMVVCVLAFGWIRTIRAAPGDFVRMLVGESRRVRIRRKLRTVLPVLIVAIVAAGAFLMLGLRVDSIEIPLGASIYRGIAEPWVWIGFGLMVVMLISSPFWSRPVSGRSNVLLPDRPTGLFTVFLAVIFGMTAILWIAGTLSVQRAHRLLDPELPAGAPKVSIQSLATEDRRWVFDRSSTAALESDLIDLGAALATAGPVGNHIIGERATIRMGGTRHNDVIHINRVSQNYFSLLGLTPRSECGPFERFPPDAVISNRRFLDLHGASDTPGALRIDLGRDRVLRVCGVVEDAHINDARAGLAPVLYAPLRERRDANVVISQGDPSMETRSGIADRVETHFPGTTVERPASVQQILDEQLQQERQVIWLNSAVMGVAGFVAWVTGWMLVSVVIEMTLRHLAVRRALGCSLGRLAGIALFGNRASPWIGAAVLTGLGIWGIARSAGAGMTELAVPTLAAAAAVLVLATATALLIPAELEDRRLWARLNRE